MRYSSNFGPPNSLSGTSDSPLSDRPLTAVASKISGVPLSYMESYGYELLVAGSPDLLVSAGTGGEFNVARDAFAKNFIRAFIADGTTSLKNIRGRFAIALRRQTDNSLLLAVDRFATIPVYFAHHGSQLLFSESCAEMPDQLRSDDQISKQSLFSYLFFHTIPGPDSIYKRIFKLSPASFLRWSTKDFEVATYWTPTFAEKTRDSFSEQTRELHYHLERAIPALPDTANVGCFLSGGLDSSTVLGYLSRSRPGETAAFSIGFGADGYDEMSYARAAAAHFGANLHEYYVTQTDIIDVIPEIASGYDQPFGNSSAVPALYCARLASAAGIDIMLAGDGGDEIFAGNERYAKQKLFEYYTRIPALLRKLLLEPVFLKSSTIPNLPIARKIGRYVEQAIVPLPDRFETYNYLHNHAMESVLSSRFLEQVDTTKPLSGLRDRFWEPEDASTLNRMLYLDWKYTLADNDLPKVTRMCQLAGIQVEFPFLHDDLVEFSTRVPSSRKLPGTKLRHFFRQSVSHFLPEKVLNKEKHGFGLPFGTWVVTDPQLRNYTYQTLERLRDREIFAPQFIDTIKRAAEEEHAAYYGTLLWVLMMLEEWLAQHH